MGALLKTENESTESSAEWQRAWGQEVLRRSKAMDDGEAGYSLDQVMAHLDAVIAEVSASKVHARLDGSLASAHA